MDISSPLPQRLPDWNSEWRLVINQPARFLARRYFSLSHSNADDKGILGCGGLIWLGGTALAFAAAKQLAESLFRAFTAGPDQVSGKETLVWAGVFLVWMLITYFIWPKPTRLEAGPGWVRFGRHRLAAAQIKHLYLRQRSHTATPVWDAQIPYTHTSFRTLEVWVTFRDGSQRRLWRYSGRQKKRAGQWVQRMGKVAGVMVKT